MAKPIELVYKQIGLKIRQLRMSLGWSQEYLANKVGLERTSIVNIENGRQRILLHDVEKFSLTFGVRPDHLLRGIWT